MIKQKLVLFVILCTQLSLGANEVEKCNQAYAKLYEEDEIRASIFLGYNDFGDQVSDQMERAYFSRLMTAPCEDGRNFCGFERDPDDAHMFYKTIKGPNGKKTKKVRIQLRSSSASELDSKNKGDLKLLQIISTEDVMEKFKQSLSTDQIVIYNGHARRGTGPGFKPMNDSDWIHAVKSKPALNQMLEALKSASKTPQILGMIVCDGESHYGQLLHQAAPKSALLLTRQTMLADDGNNLLVASMDALLGFKCQKEMKKGFNDSVMTFFKGPLEKDKPLESKLPELYGFFEPITKVFEPPKSILYHIVNEYLEDAKDIHPQNRDNSKNFR